MYLRYNTHMPNTLQENEVKLLQRMQRKAEGRVEAKWQNIGDVDWDDLEHFLENARRRKDKDSFDTAINILTALRKQVLERK